MFDGDVLIRTMPLFAGGDGEGDGDGGDSGGDSDGDGDADEGDSDGDADDDADGDADDKPLTAAEAKKLRAEQAKRRQDNKALKKEIDDIKKAGDEQRKQLAKALGLSNDDDETDPAKLQAAIGDKDKRITDLETANREHALERIVRNASDKHDGNARLVWALLNSERKLAKIDLAADNAEEQVSTAVKAAIDEDGSLKRGSSPARGGADLGGGSSDAKPKDLAGAVAARYAKQS